MHTSSSFRLLRFAALALVALFTCQGAAQADGCYGAFKLENPSSTPIHYQIKWGADSEWESYCVYPGMSKCHYSELDEDQRAPAPYIRFDCIGGDGDITYETYHLNFYATWSACGGKRYVFRYCPRGKYLDLHQG